MLKQNAKIAVIGGGIAGASTALYLSEMGLKVTLFEKEESLVNGPPWCHLHAGGNLYPDISDEQCITLLRQSIDFLRFYPFCVDYRPTVIAIPVDCTKSASHLLPRLEKLKNEYAKLIEKDPANKVLGEAAEYYRLYDKEKIEALKKRPLVKKPFRADEWLIPFAKSVDLNTIQFPVILVQEYGLNLFRAGAGITLALREIGSCHVRFATTVSDISQERTNDGWIVQYEKDAVSQKEHFDYLINASGFRTGKIDDMVGAPCERMVEFKAAYVSRWEKSEDTLWPEIVFHGERGTPRGMAQFTPYPGGYFQLHGMTKDITLYPDGLVANTPLSCQPQLGRNFMQKIEKAWSQEETKERTQSAIRHISRFIPGFADAKVGSKPLFGAQQIPGDDPTLRVAEVSFPMEHYARCEIVKVSSILDMIDAIVRELIKLGYLDGSVCGKRELQHLKNLQEEAINTLARKIAKERAYPESLADRNVAYPNAF